VVRAVTITLPDSGDRFQSMVDLTEKAVVRLGFEVVTRT
jgi:hypothetical protein